MNKEEVRARERRMKATLLTICIHFILHPSAFIPSLRRPRDDFSVFGRWGRSGRGWLRGRARRLCIGRVRVAARSSRARIVFGVRLVAILACRGGRSVARPRVRLRSEERRVGKGW